jgi:hypothetical protein
MTTSDRRPTRRLTQLIFSPIVGAAKAANPESRTTS